MKGIVSFTLCNGVCGDSAHQMVLLLNNWQLYSLFVFLENEEEIEEQVVDN
ncbi:MAG: hypothetical protein JXM68_04235 [Sedimentisphaerales bacterium]|nr:hypothetical protein [Sedimentisphaerales bacterium]